MYVPEQNVLLSYKAGTFGLIGSLSICRCADIVPCPPRKLMPTAAERLIWGFGSEEDTKIVKATFETERIHESAAAAAAASTQAEEIILSSATCWENMMVRRNCL